jgi:phosphoribosylglycinamide formyltransferase-1
VTDKLRLAVLVSGNGSNLQALIEACSAADFPAKVELVISNVPTARALERARSARVPAMVLDRSRCPNQQDFEREVLLALRTHRIGLVCLAGFMRILSASFLKAFSGPVLNIHPSLLPAFPGLNAPRQALKHGVKITGCTVHLVDEGTDTGPVLVQAAVPVLPGDDEAALAARILIEEHRIYPLAVRCMAAGVTRVGERRIEIPGEPVVVGKSLHNPGKCTA